MRAGLALAARGEFAVVIAGLAVAAGYDEIGPTTAAYVLVLAVVSPVLARFADDIARPFVRPAVARS
jgi:CPA2 family monovalent cation:H+ antiporter-2